MAAVIWREQYRAARPNSPIVGVSIVDENDIWAIGYWADGFLVGGAIYRYDGRDWIATEVDWRCVYYMPTVYSLMDTVSAKPAISAVDDGHVWAVGTSEGSSESTIRFWDGSAWSEVLRGEEDVTFVGVSAVDDSHVWALGFRPSANITQWFTGALACDPTHNLLYVGVYGSGSSYPQVGRGVWVYDGATWVSTNGPNQYPNEWPETYDVNSLAYDSVHNLLYAGGWDGIQNVGGVWKFDGTAWTDTGGGALNDYAIYSLAYDSTHNVLYAGTWYHGVWKYDGTTWTNTGGPALSGYVIDCLAFDSVHNVLYADVLNRGGGMTNGIWKYDGATWTNISPPLYYYADFGGGALAYDPVHNLLYAWSKALLGTSNHFQAFFIEGGVWKYDGTTWAETGSPGSSPVTSLAWDGTTLYAGRRNGHLYSKTGAGSWTDIGSLGDGCISSLVQAGPTLYAGCDNGHVYSKTGAGSWTDTGDIGGGWVSSLAWDGTGNILYAGCDDGHVYSKTGAGSWTDTGDTGDGWVTSLAWDGTGNTLYAGCGDGRVYSKTGAGSWTDTGDTGASPWTNTGDSGGRWVYSLAWDGTGNILYAGCGDGHVYSKTGAGSWTDTGDTGDGWVTSLAWDGTGNILYAGCDDGNVSSKIGAGSWTATGDAVGGGGSVICLVWDGTTLYAGGSNGHVCSKTGAGSWIDTRLPNYQIGSLAYDSVHNLLYAGSYDGYTGNGVVLKYDGVTWSNTGRELSGRSVADLAYDPTHNLLYASGYGVWKYNGMNWTWANVSTAPDVFIYFYDGVSWEMQFEYDASLPVLGASSPYDSNQTFFLLSGTIEAIGADNVWANCQVQALPEYAGSPIMNGVAFRYVNRAWSAKTDSYATRFSGYDSSDVWELDDRRVLWEGTEEIAKFDGETWGQDSQSGLNVSGICAVPTGVKVSGEDSKIMNRVASMNWDYDTVTTPPGAQISFYDIGLVNVELGWAPGSDVADASLRGVIYTTFLPPILGILKESICVGMLG